MTIPPQSYRELSLTKGKITILDEIEFANVSRWKWFAHKDYSTNNFYAVRQVRIWNGTQRMLYMHTYLTGFRRTDHKNRDTLDNRMENLRECTPQDNARNRSLRKDSLTGFKGVHLSQNRKMVGALIWLDGKSVGLGRFPIEQIEDAARAYDAAARKHFGEFASLNFPDQP